MSESIRNILVVGPAWVGDMVMAQSLFMSLKSRHPAAQIDVLAPAWTLPLLERMHQVRDGIPLPLGHGQLGLASRFRIGWKLRSKHYDWAIVLPRSLKSAIVPAVAGARRRTGFLGELRWGLLNDVRKLNKETLPRTVDRFNALGRLPNEVNSNTIPYPRLDIRQDHIDDLMQRFGCDTDDAPVLGLCPGAEYGPAKRWPVDHFVATANHFLDKGWQVWLFGSNKDSGITREIQRHTRDRCLDLGGATSLGEAIDMMSVTDTIITNDSGLMHVAAALDRNVIAIYGSSDPGFTPPLSDKARILRLGLECSPCFKRDCPYGHTRCLVDIEPQQVIAAVEDSKTVVAL